MAERGSGEEEDRVLRARLEKLSGELNVRRSASRNKAEASGAGGAADGFGGAMGAAMRVGGEFVASVAVGGFIGWQADAWLGTKPAFLIGFFFLGAIAGVWNIIRATTAMSRQAASERKDGDERRGD
ncbi:MAG TPA: AtpZ/AtpI family protein [Roseiarcus sp.]|nr:AtpZ/AtpI family protein [Roseiarcus sp.]